MPRPVQQLKQLPWIPLGLTALLTVFWVFVAEFFLQLAGRYLDAVRVTLWFFTTPPLDTLIQFAIAMGVGALGVFFFEAVYPHLILSAGALWGLVLCLTLALLVRSWLLPPFLVPFSSFIVVGMAVGVFWKGRPYWRYR